MSKRAGAALRLLNLGAAGGFTVPEDLTRLRTRFDRLAGLAPEPVTSLADARRDAVGSVLTATLAGRPVNVASVAAKVEGVRAAEAARLTAVSVLDEAGGVAEAELVTAVGDTSAQLCDLLDERLQALRPEFREAAEAFAPDVGLTEGALLRCDEPVRRAAVALDAFGDLLDDVFVARAMLRMHFDETAEIDTDNLCGSWRNPLQVWGGPAMLRQRTHTTQRPWPTEPRHAYPCWLGCGAGGSAAPDLWVPNAERQDEMFRRTFTDDVKQQLAGGLRPGARNAA